MTPYGIVYKNNLFALTQSCVLWQEKFGVLKVGVILKIWGIFAAIIFATAGVMSLIFPDSMFLYLDISLILSGVFILTIYFHGKNGYAKRIAAAKMNNEQKQAVLYDDKIVFTSPYSKYEISYDEILYYSEKNGILTIIIDSGMLPISIYSSCVGKGNYHEFLDIFLNKMENTDKKSGGNNI